MCIIACILYYCLYLYSEGKQLLKRNYFIVTSWTVKKKAKECHQNKLQDLLEVYFLHNIQNKDHKYISQKNKFKELFASMLKCITLLS